MSIKTSELQQLQSILGTDSLLADTAAAGTGRVAAAALAQFMDQELLKPGTALSAALSNKAALSAQQTVEATSVPSRTVEVSAADLPGYIAGLPRLLTDDLTVKVTGTAAIPGLVCIGFYGSGSLTIRAADGAEVTVYIQVLIDACTVPITLEGLQIIGDNSEGGGILVVIKTPFVVTRNCVIDREHDINTDGVAAVNGSHILLEQCQITHCNPAINCRFSTVHALNCTGGNNVVGIGIYSGIVLLTGTTPELMGGSANDKSGGLIVKSDGTLL